uniref:Vascular cell adhesion molecule 1b n=1 Tax=Oncorhynchus mykiss TaxID=8022 RepID=A0A8C7P805_ONCMY
MDVVHQSRRERKTVTVLELHYAPRGTTITVSPASEVKEGESVTVSCLSDGAPVGWMVLRRLSEDQDVKLQSHNGSSTSFTLSSALLADSALYQCEAFNEHGSQKASTHVTVKAPPRNTTVLVYPSTEVQEGQNVTVCCRSVSFPPPGGFEKTGQWHRALLPGWELPAGEPYAQRYRPIPGECDQ